jgi:hypothetical protein
MARPPTRGRNRICPAGAGVPHVAALVSQGGHGTGMKALAHGIPLVCLPLCGDQPAVAAQVVRHKSCSLAMAAPQPIAHQQRLYEVCEKQPDLACTTG